MIGLALANYFIPWERVTGAAQIATLQSQLQTATDHISALQSQLESAQRASANVSGSAPASQSDENARQIAALESQLKGVQEERDQAKQNLGTLQSQLSSKNVELSNMGQQLNRYQTRIGPGIAIGLANALSVPDALKTIPKTLVLLTSTPDNEQFRFDLEVIFNAARARSGDTTPLILMGRPNYKKDLDAPPLPETQHQGITIHGRNPAGDFLMQRVFGSNCFNKLQTAKTPDEFLTYYYLIGGANDIKDVAWIEIGDNPLLNSTGCLNQ
jgi:hypothetical protein